MAAKRTSASAKSKGKDLSASYEKVKSFHGQQYTGMAVGRTHKWYYDNENGGSLAPPPESSTASKTPSKAASKTPVTRRAPAKKTPVRRRRKATA